MMFDGSIVMNIPYVCHVTSSCWVGQGRTIHKFARIISTNMVEQKVICGSNISLTHCILYIYIIYIYIYICRYISTTTIGGKNVVKSTKLWVKVLLWTLTHSIYLRIKSCDLLNLYITYIKHRVSFDCGLWPTEKIWACQNTYGTLWYINIDPGR